LGLSREGVAQHLMWIALAFMIGVLCSGAVTDWLGRRGVSPMSVMLGCFYLCFLGQAMIISRWPALALPGWLLVAATGQAAILSYPWFAMRVGAELAGRSNATINFVMFVCAFAAQYGVGIVIGFFPVSDMGYAPEGYSWAFGGALALQFIALAWYLAAPIASSKEAPTT
jgi:hypothetical protein